MNTSHELWARVQRLLLVGSVGALVFQLALRYRASLPAEAMQVATFTVGDTLPNLTLITYSAQPQSASPRKGTSSLEDLLDSGCVLLAFFNTKCPICQNIAKTWSGLRTLAVGTDTLPLRWVATRASDTGAVRFVAEHDLADQWFMLPTPKNAVDLGVYGTPLMYLVDRNRVFQGTTLPTPSEITALPDGCASRRALDPGHDVSAPSER